MVTNKQENSFALRQKGIGFENTDRIAHLASPLTLWFQSIRSRAVITPNYLAHPLI